MKTWTKIFLGICAVGACNVATTGYRAEVGYYEGRDEKWHIGEPKSRDDCTREAFGMYYRMNEESSGRAFFWAWLVVNIADPDHFISQVR
jgi:hypothetical protein